MVPLHSAAAVSAETTPYPGLNDLRGFVKQMQKEFGDVVDLPASVAEVGVQPKAAELMQTYRFAVCLPQVDRTLVDVIAHDHTSRTTMSELKESASCMAQIINSLHECSVVHAGISPMHIVRLSPDSNELAVLDFSTSVSTKVGPPRSPTPSAKQARSEATSRRGSGHGADSPPSSTRKVGGSPTSFALASGCDSGCDHSNTPVHVGGGIALVGAKTGYTSPEFAAWAETVATKQGRSSGGAIELPRTVPGVPDLVALDIWGLGLCLFELYAGRALMPHTRGVACLSSQDRLSVWNGFDPDELDEIEHRYVERNPRGIRT